MARDKVKLQWIADRSARQAVYKRRCEALKKKTSELVTLTGSKACVLVYGEDATAPPEVWPSAAEAIPLLRKFNDAPDGTSWKKTTSQEEYLRQRILKVREQAKKLDAENAASATSRLLLESMSGLRPGLEGTTVDELVRLKAMVEAKMGELWPFLQVGGVGQGADAYPPPSLPAIGGELDAVVGGALVAGGHPPLVQNQGGEELAAMVDGGFTTAGGSGGDGPSGSGGWDAVEAFSQGCDLGYPWARE